MDIMLLVIFPAMMLVSTAIILGNSPVVAVSVSLVGLSTGLAVMVWDDDGGLHEGGVAA
jgi:hypothetical protein